MFHRFLAAIMARYKIAKVTEKKGSRAPTYPGNSQL